MKGICLKFWPQLFKSWIARMNLYPVDSGISFLNTYPLDRDLSDG